MNLRGTILIVCLVLSSAGVGQALDFEVTEIIELGPGGNYEWSPEGDKIASADEHRDGTSTLTVYDTVEQVVDVWDFNRTLCSPSLHSSLLSCRRPFALYQTVTL